MIRNLISRFTGGAATGRRPVGRPGYGHRRSAGSGATGARIGSMIERFIRRR